jgi:Ca2+-binding RTX toxin-like protein
LDASPTHSLSRSTTSIDEGSTLTTTVSTTNVASGTTLYYSLSGTGISTTDFSSGSLTGSGTVSSSGSFFFSHTLANDLTTEGTETLEIKLCTDSSRSTQVASTTVSINDTSLTPTSNVTVNGTNNGIANAGTINNNGTINTGTINTNSGNTTNNITNTTVYNTNIAYNYYTNTTNNVNSNNTTTNVSSNNTLNTWNIFRVDATVKVAEIVNQWFGTAAPTSKQSQDVTDTKLLDINASTWSDKIQINRVAKATDNGDILEALMPELGGDPRVGSVLNGGAGKDVISGRAGWDVLDGGDADDLIHGGNGRDIITGGAGRDELHGDFGWNTYKSEKDGVSDLIAIKSDQYLSNWIYGKAGNNADGSKCDIIEGLDVIDKIRIIGVDTRDITFAANVTAKGLTGIGIYGKGALEALYTGGDLTINQITQMTSGDASAAAMANQVNSYGTW